MSIILICVYLLLCRFIVRPDVSFFNDKADYFAEYRFKNVVKTPACSDSNALHTGVVHAITTTISQLIPFAANTEKSIILSPFAFFTTNKIEMLK